MTAINHGDMHPGRTAAPRRRPPSESIGAGSRRYWLGASALGLAAVAGTAAVDIGQTMSVAIGALAVAAVGGAMDYSESAPASDIPSPIAAPETAVDVYRHDGTDAAG